MARPQKFRHSREALNDPQIAEKLGRLVMDIETLRQKRKQIDDQIAAGYDAVDDAGFEKKFVRKVIALRAKETDARRDEEVGIEVYEFAVEKGVSLACARRERNLPAHDPETGEVLSGEITDQEQPETQSSVESRERQTVGVQAQGSVDSPISKPEATPMDEASNGPSGTAAEITPSTAPAVEPEAAPQAPQSASGEVSDADVPAFLKRDRYVLRPHCLNPSLCAGSGSKHCHACLKARDESILADEVAA